ncbi:MAG TPA: GNAT family N-acetyltransferase [Candidatus Paceibacterota bacterium]
MTLKKATIEDAKMLLDWRNDPLTRAQSINTDEIKLADHEAWLKKTLDNSDRELFVAYEDGVPVGTCRIDRESNGGESIFELSWTIAPSARGKGMGKKMLGELINVPKLKGQKLKAVIRPDNLASIKMAEHFSFIRQDGEVRTDGLGEWFRDN